MITASILFAIFAVLVLYVSALYTKKTSLEFKHEPPVLDTTCLISRGIDPDIFDGLISCIREAEIGVKDCAAVQIRDDEKSRDFIDAVLHQANSVPTTKGEYFLAGVLENACSRIENEMYSNFTFITSRCLVHEKNTHTTIRVVVTGMYDTVTSEAILLDIETDVCTM